MKDLFPVYFFQYSTTFWFATMFEGAKNIALGMVLFFSKCSFIKQSGSTNKCPILSTLKKGNLIFNSFKTRAKGKYTKIEIYLFNI